jgi:hypothetical protein
VGCIVELRDCSVGIVRQLRPRDVTVTLQQISYCTSVAKLQGAVAGTAVGAYRGVPGGGGGGGSSNSPEILKF